MGKWGKNMDMTDIPNFGPILKRLRKEAGMTQDEVVEATGFKLQSGYLSQIERKPISISVPVLSAICKAVGASVSDVIREEAGGESTVVTGLSVPILSEKGEATGMYMPVPKQVNIDSFAFQICNETMQTNTGVSYYSGGYIIASKTNKPIQPNQDYIFEIDGFMVPAEYQTDGRRHILKYKNPSFPPEVFSELPKTLGIITGFIYF